VASAQISYSGSYDAGNNEWVADAVVEFADPHEFGSITIKALNPSPNSFGASAYFTFVVNELTPSYTRAIDVDLRVYDPAGAVNTATVNVNSNDFYETDQRSYPTIFDGVVEALYARIIDRYTPRYSPGLGDIVDAFVIDGATYQNSGLFGWQYRVYRQIGNTGYYAVVPLSENMGPDAFKVLDNDVIIWKYGTYGDPNLFDVYVA
jgi:hypothetical protein